MLAVIIPLHACDRCRRTAKHWIELGRKEPFAQIFLQDRDNDAYQVL